MKTITRAQACHREGGVLLMAMFVMLVFSVLAIGLFKLRETDAVESVYVEQYKQAFWLAESGLADGELLVGYDENFRNSPYAVFRTNTTVGGSYDVGVAKTTVNATTEEYEYIITSTGTVRGVTRILQTTHQSIPGGKYAIIGIDGHTDLASNVDVEGPIAQINGTFEVHDSRGLDGYLIMGDGEGALSDKKGEATVVNYPPPPVPVIDFANYEAAIAKLAANTNYPHMGTINVSDSTLSGTLYYDAVEVIVGGTGTKVEDGTTIVTTGDISFSKSHVEIGNNVTIIAKNFSIANQAEIGGGTLIYTQKDIYLRNASDTTIVGEAAVVLLARGSIEFDSQIDFRGVIFAEDDVQINANGTIEGTIIGGVGVDVDANITITYDESVFKEGTPVTPKTFGDVILTRLSWRELPSL